MPTALRLPLLLATCLALAPAASGARVVPGWLPPGPGGTGTSLEEAFLYQLPDGYDPDGPPRPMLIAWHGYGGSPANVTLKSGLDEECNERGWVYLAVTGGFDTLFGTPIAQDNVAAAIQWMLHEFQVDPDRLFMVGFSMGGGATLSFAARHRDPGGIVLAGLGVVSGVSDWVAAWSSSSPEIQAVLENPLNFGAPPEADPFAYRRVGGLAFAPGSYPPLPGTLDPAQAMVTNLGGLPVFVTWDEDDHNENALAQCPALAEVLGDLGATVKVDEVSGTLEFSGGQIQPAPHSWAVLNENKLFNFFQGRVADRRPASFEAQLDATGTVSWARLEQRTPGSFSRLTGEALPGAPEGQPAHLDLDRVVNAAELRVDLTGAGVTDPVVSLSARSADEAGFRLRLAGHPLPPAYLRTAKGQLVTGVASDPFDGALLLDVEGDTGVHLELVTDAHWTGRVWSEPRDGQPVLHIEGPPGAPTALVVLGRRERLVTLPPDHVMTVDPRPPEALVLTVPLDARGTASLPLEGMPTAEVRPLRAQAVFLGSPGQVLALSNAWVVPSAP